MRLYCKYCDKYFNVRGAYAWRYRSSRACRDCGRIGKPDESGQNEISSRNRETVRSINKMDQPND